MGRVHRESVGLVLVCVISGEQVLLVTSRALHRAPAVVIVSVERAFATVAGASRRVLIVPPAFTARRVTSRVRLALRPLSVTPVSTERVCVCVRIRRVS
jgi:hypothetical protein